MLKRNDLLAPDCCGHAQAVRSGARSLQATARQHLGDRRCPIIGTRRRRIQDVSRHGSTPAARVLGIRPEGTRLALSGHTGQLNRVTACTLIGDRRRKQNAGNSFGTFSRIQENLRNGRPEFTDLLSVGFCECPTRSRAQPRPPRRPGIAPTQPRAPHR
jgi:hypothetical protein